MGVAIIDSGISTKTAALPNLVFSMDFTNSNGRGGDLYGHGTHVAGIVGGSGADGGSTAIPYAGVAPGSRLIDLRVLDNTGTGSTSSVIDGHRLGDCQPEC